MSLHYVIDGYNALYALAEIPSGSWETKRKVLLAKVAKENPHGKNRITMVFDSREGPGSQSKEGDIHIVYTAGETADDWIGGYVRHISNPRIVIVVTNDQGLCRLIRGTGAKSMATEEFWKQGKSANASVRAPKVDIDVDSITEELKKKWL